MSFSLTSHGTTTILPSPSFSDQEGSTVEVDIQYAQDGTPWSYVKTKGGRRKFQWTFGLSREKGLELMAFIDSYFSSEVTIVDHRNRTIIGNFVVNPFEFRTTGKGLRSLTQGVRHERMETTFEFEGIIQ